MKQFCAFVACFVTLKPRGNVRSANGTYYFI